MPVSSSNDRLDWVLIDWVPIDENPIVKGLDGKPRLSSKCAQASLTSVTGSPYGSLCSTVIDNPIRSRL